MKSEVVECDVDPAQGRVSKAPRFTPQDVASDPRSLVQVAGPPDPLVQSRPPREGCWSIETTVRMRRLFLTGALIKTDNRRLPKRIMVGTLKIQSGVDGKTRRKSERIAWQTIYGCLGSGMGRDGKLWH